MHLATQSACDIKNDLSTIVRRVQIFKIMRSFVNKLKANVVPACAAPLQYQHIQEQNEKRRHPHQISSLDVTINVPVRICIVLFELILVQGIFLLTTLQITFQEINELNQIFKWFKIIYCLLIITRFFRITIEVLRSKEPYRSSDLIEIFFVQDYRLLQLAALFVIILQIGGIPYLNYLNVFIFFRAIIGIKRRFRFIENQIFTNSIYEQYWELAKIFLINFFLAHLLSIILNLMIKTSPQRNWIVAKGIQDEDWKIKYVWGYYWGINIMLTVGFGDIVASNQNQALFLIFIQTFSCLILAYNFSTFSGILYNMRELSKAKNKRHKLFNEICAQQMVPFSFKTKVDKLIDSSIQIEDQLNTKAEQAFIQQFPISLQRQIRRQTNRYMLQSLPFFVNCTYKAVNSIAESFTKVVAYPDQFVARKYEQWPIIILRAGHINALYNRGKSLMNGCPINQFNVQSNQSPKLLSIKFIRNKLLNCDLKSSTFSVYSHISLRSFHTILKQLNDSTFEYYCSLRDGTEPVPNEEGTQECSICKNVRHLLIDCPKMSYIPMRYFILSKLMSKNVSRQQKRDIYFIRKPLIKKSYYALKTVRQTYPDFLKQILSPSKSMVNYNLKRQNSNDQQFLRKINECNFNTQEALRLLQRKHVNVEDLDVATNYVWYFSNDNPKNFVKKSLKSDSFSISR